VTGTTSGYPVTLRLDGRSCLVVGGGRVAAAKAAGLVAAGAAVTMVAPEVDPEVRALSVEVVERPYRPSDLDGRWLVLTATGLPSVDGAVHADGESLGVWVNAADDPEHCSFTLPAVVRRGPVSVAVATDGRSPALASWLRRRLEVEIGPEYETLARLLADQRDDLRSAGTSTEGLPWQAALDAGLVDLVRDGREDEAQELLRRLVRPARVERTAWQ
jgi:precorrin-2 dehydrogenase / sirohydrochlorin ferrochelatase